VIGEKGTVIYNNEEDSLEDAPSQTFTADEEPLIGLVGDITEEAAQQVAMMLLSFNGGKILNTEAVEKRPDDLEFFLSSAGGNVNEMFTIYDLMRLVKEYRDIATFGYGKISSAAVPLLAAGTKGKRYMAKNARLMLHRCSANASGSGPAIRTSFNELKKVEDMMVEILTIHTKLSAGELFNILSQNTDEYFSAQEALEMGIVDKII